jgi:hypothetical protein
MVAAISARDAEAAERATRTSAQSGAMEIMHLLAVGGGSKKMAKS